MIKRLYLRPLLIQGTIISIRPIPNLNLTAAISFRLKSRDTVLRSSADPSLLLHSLLDLGKFIFVYHRTSYAYFCPLVVDKAVQVIEAYHTIIHKIELQSLLRPEMGTVRDRMSEPYLFFLDIFTDGFLSVLIVQCTFFPVILSSTNALSTLSKPSFMV